MVDITRYEIEVIDDSSYRSLEYSQGDYCLYSDVVDFVDDLNNVISKLKYDILKLLDKLDDTRLEMCYLVEED